MGCIIEIINTVTRDHGLGWLGSGYLEVNVISCGYHYPDNAMLLLPLVHTDINTNLSPTAIKVQIMVACYQQLIF